MKFVAIITRTSSLSPRYNHTTIQMGQSLQCVRRIHKLLLNLTGFHQRLHSLWSVM